MASKSKQPFRSLADVLSSGILEARQRADHSRIFHSKRLDDLTYQDLRNTYDTGLDAVEAAGTEKVPTFPSMLRDTFQSLYSMNPQKTDESSLSAVAKQFNLPIMDKLRESDAYPVIKKHCEGRSIPAYEAVRDFTQHLMDHVDELLSGDDNHADMGKMLRTLEQLDKQRQKLEEKASMIPAPQGTLDHDARQKMLRLANEMASKDEQIEYISRQIERKLSSNRATQAIQAAMSAAAEAAQQAATVISGWGNEDGSIEAHEQNYALVQRVRQSARLQGIMRQLGNNMELLHSAKRNNFAYGRGDKYDIQLGGDYTRALTSEYALLAHQATAALFTRKAIRKELKQYRRRERISKGEGDFIVCLDTSGSMKGRRDEWSKALALTVMDMAEQNKRSFALINFSTTVRTDIFLPGGYFSEDVFTALEVFQGGGTRFEKPLIAAMELMDKSGFEKADILFITDGECMLSDAFCQRLLNEKKQRRFTITGVVIDEDSPGQTFSLEPFCDQVHRLTEMVTDGDGIISAVVSSRV